MAIVVWAERGYVLHKQIDLFAIRLGLILLFLAVVIGAFGAHAVKDLLVANQRLDVFDTASQYHFYHAFGVVLMGLLSAHAFRPRLLHIAARAMALGVLLFPGSLYLLALANLPWLGTTAPIGGVLLMVSWPLAICGFIKT